MYKTHTDCITKGKLAQLPRISAALTPAVPRCHLHWGCTEWHLGKQTAFSRVGEKGPKPSPPTLSLATESEAESTVPGDQISESPSWIKAGSGGAPALAWPQSRDRFSPLPTPTTSGVGRVLVCFVPKAEEGSSSAGSQVLPRQRILGL